MDFEITEWFVRQFSNTVYHLAQQRNTRLWNYARQESQNSKMKSFDRIGGTEALAKGARHEDTPRVDMEHTRRNVILQDFHWSALVDDVDKIRLLNMPTSEYVIEAKNAFNRKKDDVFIKAFSANALAGEDGTESVAFDANQRFAANDGTNFSQLNLKTLRYIKRTFLANEVISDDAMDKVIHMSVTAADLDALLEEAEIGSADYNNVKALINGEVDYFMGIKFHHTERLVNESEVILFNTTTGKPDAGGSSVQGFRKLLCWVPSGMIVSTGKDITARISERDDKCYSVQPYVKMTIGAVRMDEAKCMEVFVENI